MVLSSFQSRLHSETPCQNKVHAPKHTNARGTARLYEQDGELYLYKQQNQLSFLAAPSVLLSQLLQQEVWNVTSVLHDCPFRQYLSSYKILKTLLLISGNPILPPPSPSLYWLRVTYHPDWTSSMTSNQSFFTKSIFSVPVELLFVFFLSQC